LKKVYTQLILAIFFSSIFGSSIFTGLFHFQRTQIKLNSEIRQLIASSPDYWPNLGWKTSTPEEQGIDSQYLEQMENSIEEQGLKGFIDSILIIRNGYLTYETYPSGFYDENRLHNIYSCTKSIISALIGIAIGEGYINTINDRIIDYFPNSTIDSLDSQKQSITIKHLLTMTSGLKWDDSVNYNEMTIQSDWVQYVLERPMDAQPGMAWNYNTGGSHLLSGILENVTPNGTLAYAASHIFDPLNITNYIWSTDHDGIPIGGTGLQLNPRDMAKFGFLYLHDGYWNGTQLIPSSWVSESQKTYWNLQFEENQGLGYGYQWWVYKWAHSYAAIGAYKQYIMVVEDLNLILAVNCNTDFPFINIIVDFILPSAEFVPFNPLLVIILIAGPSALGIFLLYKYVQFRKKKSSIEVRNQV
jgi:CubicO group peptidase (beta-lactamase class C family)